MAARGEPDGVYGDFEDDFSCAICSEVFNDKERTPKLLPCHHSFCSQCLYKCAAKNEEKKFECGMKEEDKKFKCPLCNRKVSLLPDDVKELQDNFYLLNMMDKLVKKPMNVTKKTGTKENEERKRIICQIHKMEIVNICESCNVNLCGKCLALSIAEHSKHKVSVVEEVLAEREEMLMNCQFLLSKARQDLMQKEKEDLHEFEKDVNMMTNKVKSTAKELHKQIDDWERSSCAELTKSLENKRHKQGDFIKNLTCLDKFDSSLRNEKAQLHETANIKTSSQLINIAKGIAAELNEYNPSKMFPVLEKEPTLTTSKVTIHPQTKERLKQEPDLWKRVENIIDGKSNRNLSGPEQAKMMVPGTRVIRGKDWKWEDQDGNGPGTVVHGADYSDWITVKWDSGRQDGYRMGRDRCYDLQLL